jgi:hypothetical protein
MEPPADLDDEFFPIIGHIAVYAARIESIADTVLSELVSHADWDRVHVLTYGQAVGWVLDQIETLDKGLTKTSQTTTAMAWVKEARTAVRLRNMVLHSVWLPNLFPNDDLCGMGSVRGGVTGVAMGLTRMQEISDTLRSVWLAGIDLDRYLAGNETKTETTPRTNEPGT